MVSFFIFGGRVNPMKQIKHFLFTTIVLFGLFIMTGCVSPRIPVSKCTIIFEDNPSLYFPSQVYEVTTSEDLSISIGIPHGERISSINYEDYTISAKTGESLSYDYYDLTLSHIKYSAVIRLTTAPSYTTVYHLSEGKTEIVLEESPHLYFNTLPYDETYTKEGYVPVGWNTEADGSGIHVGFGNRIDHSGHQELHLYLEWFPASNPSDFTYEISPHGEITITGYQGNGSLVIPDQIDNCPVTSIDAYAFKDISASYIVLPPSLKTVSAHSFGSIQVQDFYFFDTLSGISEDAFENYQITHLHINAATAPVYSGSYFDTLADKVDYLSSLANEKKIVLFCGSSARFGYDSPKLEAAFPDYKVVNMGVYAYSNMLPQAKILQLFMKEGDILLSSPELDAIDMQFCGESSLDKETFCMLESNYDMLAWLDCRDFSGIFHAFQEYNLSRMDMEPRSYLDSPSYYDEDGRQLNSYSYNRYGDYIVFRENNEAGRTFGIKRAFYNPDYIHTQDLDGINAVYDTLNALGVTVFFTYSPRSEISISEDSTEESILLLDELFRNQLHAQIITSIEDSLMDAYYFYGTDNHLSTEGVELHTQQIIEALQNVLEDTQ